MLGDPARLHQQTVRQAGIDERWSWSVLRIRLAQIEESVADDSIGKRLRSRMRTSGQLPVCTGFRWQQLRIECQVDRGSEHL